MAKGLFVVYTFYLIIPLCHNPRFVSLQGSVLFQIYNENLLIPIILLPSGNRTSSQVPLATRALNSMVIASTHSRYFITSKIEIGMGNITCVTKPFCLKIPSFARVCMMQVLLVVVCLCMVEWLGKSIERLIPWRLKFSKFELLSRKWNIQRYRNVEEEGSIWEWNGWVLYYWEKEYH